MPQNIFDNIEMILNAHDTILKTLNITDFINHVIINTK